MYVVSLSDKTFRTRPSPCATSWVPLVRLSAAQPRRRRPIRAPASSLRVRKSVSSTVPVLYPPVRGAKRFSAQSAQHSAQLGAGAQRATEERPWRCSSSTSSIRCSACCLGHLQRRHRCRHHSTSRPSVARGGLPSRGLTVACARDVADCRGSVHLGCALMHRQQQASAAACWRARALGLSRCGLPRWCQGVHSGCSCACVRM